MPQSIIGKINQWDQSNLEIFPPSQIYNVLVGTNLNTSGYKFLVVGNSKLEGNLEITGTLSAVIQTLKVIEKTDDNNYLLTFITSTGNQIPFYSNSQITYNPSTNIFSVGKVNSNLINSTGYLTSNLSGLIQNNQLQNDDIIIDGNNLELGSSYSQLVLDLVNSTGYLTSNLSGLIQNNQLQNDNLTIGTTNILLGNTTTILTGLSSINSSEIIIGTLTLIGGSITDSGGTITFGSNNLSTSGTLGAGVATLASNSTIGNLTLVNGSITDSGGSISFGSDNLNTTGTIDSGNIIITGSSIPRLTIRNTTPVSLDDEKWVYNVNGNGSLLIGPHNNAGGSVSAITLDRTSFTTNLHTYKSDQYSWENSSAVGTEWLNLSNSGLLVKNDITLTTGSITSASGAISFGSNNLTTTGDANIGDVVFSLGDNITSTSGLIDFQSTSLSSTGSIEGGSCLITGNVGIGASPLYKLDVDSGASTYAIRFHNDLDTDGWIFRNIADNKFAIHQENVGDRMVFDNGNVGIRNSSPAVALDVQGSIISRNTSIDYGSMVGRVLRGTDGTNGSGVFFNSSTLMPTNKDGTLTDNGIDLGNGSYRWRVVYAGTGTINTSDRNMKDNIQDLEENEIKVATELSDMIKTFKFKDAIKEKGDKARIHTGFIAQEVEDVFNKYELDAMKYGLLCIDNVYKVDGEKVDKEGNIYTKDSENVKVEKVYGVRMVELLCFMNSGLNNKYNNLLKRIEALEN